MREKEYGNEREGVWELERRRMVIREKEDGNESEGGW